jgi:hypothetical protein
MYMYTALIRNGSKTYHGGQAPWCPLFENLWGDRWGKGKGESGTSGARDFHPEHPDFGVLKLEPWRIELADGPGE